MKIARPMIRQHARHRSDRRLHCKRPWWLIIPYSFQHYHALYELHFLKKCFIECNCNWHFTHT